jgi:MshEN domain/PilZ domain
MPETSNEQRQHTRLPGKSSSAEEFSGGRAEDLPETATVADVSTGGVGLRFSWRGGEEFPLESNDGLAFRLKLEGSGRQFDLMSVVRHIKSDPGDGTMCVGVEFSGLAEELREELKHAVVSLAVTSLRSWSSTKAHKRKVRSDPEAAAGLPRSDTKRRKLYLGEILVKQGALEANRLEKFLTEEFSGQQKLGEELTGKGLVNEVALAKALAEQARLPYLDLDATPPDMSVVARLPQELFTRHWCLPMREEEGALLVAMSSPPDLETFSEMREALGRRLRIGIAPADKLAECLKRAYNLEGAPRPRMLSFTMQLHAEYRFLTSDWKEPVDPKPSAGLTASVSSTGMVIAGPLPEGITPERIAAEDLKLAVRISCPELLDPMAMGCTLLSVQDSKYTGEHRLECHIEKFPKDGELAWSRLCLVRGTKRFHAGVM